MVLFPQRFQNAAADNSNHSAPELGKSTPRTLEQTLAQIISDIQRQHEHSSEVQFELDCDSVASCIACPPTVRELATRLIVDATQRSEAGDEVLVSAYETSRGLEIEIADNSNADDCIATNAFATQRVATAGSGPVASEDSSENEAPHGDLLAPAAEARYVGRFSFSLTYARCPQGGLATTIIIPSRTAKAIAA